MRQTWAEAETEAEYAAAMSCIAATAIQMSEEPDEGLLSMSKGTNHATSEKYAIHYDVGTKRESE